MKALESVGVVHDLLGRASQLAVVDDDFDPGLGLVVSTLALKSLTLLDGSTHPCLPSLLPDTVSQCVDEAWQVARSWPLSELPKSAIGFVQELDEAHRAVAALGRS